MKLSFAWLKELTGFNWSPEITAEKLAELGFPAESIERKGVQVSQVISVKILHISKHPNADRLQIARVTDGKNEIDIVCGAPNIQVGQVVPLALPGAKLPNGMEITVSSIRGVESKGMLCSERELGLSAEHSGILQLPQDAKLGKEVKDVLGGQDVILDIEVTPNRPDMLSHIGAARELSALSQKPIKIPEIKKINGAKKNTDCPIKIGDAKRCSFYSGTIIRGVKIGPSPAWMAERLKNCGIRSINNVVDITNYVLLEWGHPLHAFDLTKLRGPEIQVRAANPGELFSALDEKTYVLTPSDLVISDSASVVALAGIMGGQLSGVTDTTTDLLLESAVFEPSGVRQTSRRLTLRSESSIRFEKGTDIETAKTAAFRAIGLILQSAGGSIESWSWTGKKEVKPVKIRLRNERLDQILGAPVATSKVGKYLRQLGFAPKATKQGWDCFIPPYRHDLIEEIDLIEEVARLEGYNSFPSHPPKAIPYPVPETFRPKNSTLLGGVLRGMGLTETITNTFCPKDITQDFSVPADRVLTLANPLSKEESALRPLLILNLLKAVLNNQNHQRNSVQLFEFGKSFLKTAEGHLENLHLGLVAGGEIHHGNWQTKLKFVDVYHLKGLFESLRYNLNIDLELHPQSKEPFLHPYQSFDISYRGKKIGWGGMLHPKLISSWGFSWPVGISEIDLKTISFQNEKVKVVSVQKFPFVERDIAVLVEKNKPWGELAAQVQESAGSYLAHVVPFDLFEGGSMNASQKSIAFRVRLQHPDHTLAETEINGIIDKIKNSLQQHCGATIR